MADVAREIFDDLLSLEVDIILKQNMTARKMPDLPQALIDIAQTYDVWLRTKVAELNVDWMVFLEQHPPPAEFGAAEPGSWLVDDDRRPIARLLYGEVLGTASTTVSAETFDGLRTIACQVEAMCKVLMDAKVRPDDGSSIMARRIFRNCDQLKGILEGRTIADPKRSQAGARLQARGVDRSTKDPRAVPMSADEILVVRKAWEVGTEEVLMQTVVQLDGDVITRIRNGREGPENRPLHDLHRDAVGTAMSNWHFLVDTLMQITKSAAHFHALTPGHRARRGGRRPPVGARHALRAAAHVLRHPWKGWGDTRRLLDELFRRGGAIITTPIPSHCDDPVLARSVVQPDGDFLVQVVFSHQHDAEFQQRHMAQVSAWFEDRKASLVGIQLIAGSLSWLGGLAVGARSAATVAASLGWVGGAMAMTVVTLAGRLVLGFAWRGLLHRGVRQLMGSF